MHRPSPFKKGGRRLEVKMTPMIDVVFLLLIFFVCTASFRAPEQVLPSDLSLPGSTPVVDPIEPDFEDLERVVITLIDEGGTTRWGINDNRYESLAAIRQVLIALARLETALPVILDVEGNVSLGDVIDVFDLCRGAGFKKVQFASSVEV